MCLPSKKGVSLKQDLMYFPFDERFVRVKSKGKISVVHQEAVNMMRSMLSKRIDYSGLS